MSAAVRNGIADKFYIQRKSCGKQYLLFLNDEDFCVDNDFINAKNNSQEVIKYDDEEDTQSAEVHLAELAKSIHPKRTIASSCREMLKELKDLTFEPYDPMLKMAECMECNEWIHATCGKIPAKVFSNKHEIYICRSCKK